MLCTPWIDPPEECIGVDGPLDVEDATRAALVASQLLYLATGAIYSGVCLDTIVGCGSCGTMACGCAYGTCGDGPYVDLPGRPVINIATVTIDDVEVDDGRLLIENDHRLILTASPAGAPPHYWGTDWSITYRYGPAPQQFLVDAADLLACQLIAGWQGDDCDIPDEVISATRENLTYQWQDITDVLPSRTFGHARIDGAVGHALTDPGGQVVLVSDFMRPKYRRVRPVVYVPVV